MAIRSRKPDVTATKYDVQAFVQSRASTTDEDGNVIVATDQPRLECWCNIIEKGLFDGEKEVIHGEESKIDQFKVKTAFDEELYTALLSTGASLEFDGRVCAITNVICKPSFARADKVEFIATAGRTDFSKV